MQVSIEPDCQYDPAIMSIDFLNSNENPFVMKINFYKSDAATVLAQHLGVAVNILKIAHNPQGFEMEQDKKIITLRGNIFNALHLLKNQNLISGKLCDSIVGNREIDELLKKSKSYVNHEEEERIKKAVAQVLGGAPADENHKCPRNF